MRTLPFTITKIEESTTTRSERVNLFFTPSPTNTCLDFGTPLIPIDPTKPFDPV